MTSIDVADVAKELGERYAAAGFSLYLVGGVVRDTILGRARAEDDLDFATEATPSESTRVLQGWADARYMVGARFGTVGARKHDRTLEITTFREEIYREDDRHPVVTFSKEIETDLSRRDFTV